MAMRPIGPRDFEHTCPHCSGHVVSSTTNLPPKCRAHEAGTVRDAFDEWWMRVESEEACSGGPLNGEARVERRKATRAASAALDAAIARADDAARVERLRIAALARSRAEEHRVERDKYADGTGRAGEEQPGWYAHDAARDALLALAAVSKSRSAINSATGPLVPADLPEQIAAFDAGRRAGLLEAAGEARRIEVARQAAHDAERNDEDRMWSAWMHLGGSTVAEEIAAWCEGEAGK